MNIKDKLNNIIKTSICAVLGHSGKYDVGLTNDVTPPLVCKRCGHSYINLMDDTTLNTPPMPPVKPPKKDHSTFVFDPEESNQINLLECLKSMVDEYCDRDEKDLSQPADEQRCPCIESAQRLIYSIEFHDNPPPF